MRAHTITTQARVGGRGRMKRRIVPGGILALSLAVVLMAATASTASAEPGPLPRGTAHPHRRRRLLSVRSRAACSALTPTGR